LFLLFLLDDRRIRKAQKHVDPDPKPGLKRCSGYLGRALRCLAGASLTAARGGQGRLFRRRWRPALGLPLDPLVLLRTKNVLSSVAADTGSRLSF
jgi:hypothetical protein